MSQSINFEKSIKIQDIIDKTSLSIKVVNDAEWLVNEDGGKAALYRSDRDKEYLGSISRYGINIEFGDIVDEIVLTFQTRFITDEEFESIYYDIELDIDKLYDDITKSYGFEIKDGVISK